ncbi:MAG: BTAD domain-containing putative transcriptional regulator, partial [Anaerolineales bacterium]
MPRLEIRLLGPPQVRQGGEAVAGLRSDKVRALLAYLVVEAEQPHRREKLAGLLWPGYPEKSARASLRRALADLRLAIGDKEASPAFLEITRRTIQFERTSDVWVDVAAFGKLAKEVQSSNGQSIDAWEEAAALYHGEFLEGFSLPDSPAFEEWLVVTREQLRREELETLGRLAETLEDRGEYERGLEYTWRRVELDPLSESAQQGLMRLLALNGQRQAVLAQFENYVNTLKKELGVDPSVETQAIYEQIREGSWPPAVPAEPTGVIHQPRAIGECPYRGLAAFREQDAPFFFGREMFTQQILDLMQTRRGTAVIIGPSGSGKTSTAYAGVIPHMRSEAGWLVVTLRPGADPFISLSAALLPVLEPKYSETERLVECQKLATALREDSLPLGRVFERILEKNPEKTGLLIFINQFEELFALCRQPDIQHAFMDGLINAFAHQNERRDRKFALLLTLRADFTGRALTYRPFADILQSSSLMLGPMDRAELRAAIEKPAEVQGAAFESGLVNRILEDVGREPGNLPLLEFALTLLWEQAEAGWLTHAGYDQIGGVEGALARYAEQVFSELHDDDRQKAEQVFLQLIRPGEGTEDTRRVASRVEIGDQNWPLVQHLADKRLVVTGRDVSGKETVEVV